MATQQRTTLPHHATAIQQQLPVHILRTKNREQEDCYFIIRAGTAQFNKLLAKKARGTVNIAEYGEILASGYGRTPLPHVVARLRDQFGIDLPLEN